MRFSVIYLKVITGFIRTKSDSLLLIRKCRTNNEKNAVYKATLSKTTSIPVGDLNKDSYLGLIVVNRGSNEILIHNGIGDGSFLSSNSQSVGYNAQSQLVKIGDVNNDDILDIIAVNYETNHVEILFFQRRANA